MDIPASRAILDSMASVRHDPLSVGRRAISSVEAREKAVCPISRDAPASDEEHCAYVLDTERCSSIIVYRIDDESVAV